MPAYDYRCADCRSAIEVRADFNHEHPGVCACGGALERIYAPPTFNRSGQPADPLHTRGAEFLSRPDSFRTTMQAFEAKTGLGLTSVEMDAALDRLNHAG